MRSFSELANVAQLQEYLDTPSGTLYFNPNAHTTQNIPLIVRRFNHELPPELVRPFAQLTAAAQSWIEMHPELASLARVEQPLEVGHDFIARIRHTYHTSTRSYTDWESPPDTPTELWDLRKRFCEAARCASDRRTQFMITILARSILEPSGKTYFEDNEGRFIIVELKPEKEELEVWSSETQAG